MKTLIILLTFLSFDAVFGQSKKNSGYSNIPFDTVSRINWFKDFKYVEIVIFRKSPQTIYEIGKELLTKEEQSALVTTKANVKNGIGTFCPPDWCYWYILVVYRDGQVGVVDSNRGLKKMITEVKGLRDAIFLQTIFEIGESNGYPSPKRKIAGQYKQTNKGFFILVNRRINDCPITYADIVFFVDWTGNVKVKKKKITSKSDGCI